MSHETGKVIKMNELGWQREHPINVCFTPKSQNSTGKGQMDIETQRNTRTARKEGNNIVLKIGIWKAVWHN